MKYKRIIILMSIIQPYSKIKQEILIKGKVKEKRSLDL